MYSNEKTWFNIGNVLFFLKKIKRDVIGPHNNPTFSLWLQKQNNLIPVDDIRLLKNEIAFIGKKTDSPSQHLFNIDAVIDELEKIDRNNMTYTVINNGSMGPIVAVKYDLEKTRKEGKAILVSDWVF